MKMKNALGMLYQKMGPVSHVVANKAIKVMRYTRQFWYGVWCALLVRWGTPYGWRYKLEDKSGISIAMKAIREQNALPLKYRKITSYVGFSGVCLGLLLFVELSSRLLGWFEVEPDIPLRIQFSSELLFALFLGSQIASLILSVYIGVVCIAGIFSLVMYILGKFTKREAILYTFLSRFPSSWKAMHSSL
ncbi:hypothetical protein L4D08_00345 [Photobacterium chitinilyticum]|uniref:hypothetical protein n=1 Tax=Photobacterium chitinilyticum TaxID=2485123 RepID=UPI003D0F62FD